MSTTMTQAIRNRLRKNNADANNDTTNANKTKTTTRTATAGTPPASKLQQTSKRCETLRAAPHFIGKL